MINYNGLNVVLALRNLKRIDLVNNSVVTHPTLSKMTKNKYISTESIDKICDFLDCQPADIMTFERITKETNI